MERTAEEIDEILEAELARITVKVQKNADESITVNCGGETIVVEKFNATASTLTNKSIILYGASGSGKTTSIKYILDILRESIPTFICICPTNEDNHSYDGIVQDSCISPNMQYTELKKFWEWQSNKKSIYNRVNDYEFLTELAANLGLNIDKGPLVAMEKKYLELRRMILSREYPNKSQDKDRLDAEYKKYCVEYLKGVIRQNISTEKVLNMGDNYKFALQFLDFTPNTCIIFDDFTSQLKTLSNFSEKDKEEKWRGIMNTYFTTNRHKMLTIIVACHDPTQLLPQIRENAHFSILGTKTMALRYITNTFKGDKMSLAIAKAIFDEGTQPHKYAKALYDQNNSKWYYFVAKPVGDDMITLGSENVKKYCKSLETKGKQRMSEKPIIF
jgi:hypothetical protein